MMAANHPSVPSPVKPERGELTPEQQRVARKLLIQGATFEDVVLTLHAQGHRVAQHEVENYYRANPELQALRAKHTLEVARRIRIETKQGDPEDVQLADAVIMTGLQRLNRATAQLDVNDALRRRLENENLNSRRNILRVKARNEFKLGKLIDAKTRLLIAQSKKVRHEFEKTIELARQGQLSASELAAKIEEIYGLVRAPVLPAGPQAIEE